MQQECCTALANLSYADTPAAAAIQDAGAIGTLMAFIRRGDKNEGELDVNDPSTLALQDAACGVLLNLCCAEGEVGHVSRSRKLWHSFGADGVWIELTCGCLVLMAAGLYKSYRSEPRQGYLGQVSWRCVTSLAGPHRWPTCRSHR